jgi:hypothetical protein
MSKLLKILMQRDGMTFGEAKDAIREAKQQVAAGCDPEEILYEDFGLEPDYIFEILP